MGKIYVIQWFHLYFSYTTLPGTVVDTKIRYIAPDKTEGEFPATHDTVGKQFYYNSPVEEPYEIKGTWKFQGICILDTGEEVPSETIEQYISKLYT